MNAQNFSVNQADIAVRIGDAATKMGLNPDYAIMVLFGDTNFNAAEFGDSEEEVNEGINANVAALRDAAVKFRDPDKAAIAFYEGENSPYFESNNKDDLQPFTQASLENVFKQGPFPKSMFLGTGGEEAAKNTEDQNTQPPTQPITDEQIASQRRAAQTLGGTAGAVVSATKGIKDVVRGGMPAPKTTNILGERPVANQPAAGAPRPGPVAQPQVASGATGTLSLGTTPQAERILQGTTEEGTTGRARMQGYNIETAQQAARNKQAQSVLEALQRQGVLDPQKNFFASQAGLTSTPSGIVYPRTEPPRTVGPRGPLGQIGPTQAPLPPPSPPPLPPSPPSKTSGLEYVTRKFEQIANNPVTKFIGKSAERYGLPVLAGTQVLGEGVTAAGEYQRGDIPGAIASGLSSLGAAASLVPYPLVRYPGLALSMVGPAYRSIREGLGKKPEPTPGLMSP